ncbi:hypothetical protein C8J46_11311 [Sphingomonas sp. PP-F2F-A104-K0414]|uniref:DUF1993 domain-containing protein n=1 Tax=Sphingomonas sp. PP-F2F-A104-K0414 TaxID=2135661 RepID=UPI0010534E2B|nr:DUF1993 domain-containing protein [Sphingomonas sp. PP-F2F-A104-K0414]TCP95421.1 hypothetical protein C8J46_11311 [Sphingomonas sp. PP-F2F-A104-K0414]
MTSLYDLTVPAFRRGFASLSTILTVGETFARDHGIAEADMLDTRLTADMTPLTAQVQRASDTAKGAMVRIGDIPNLAMVDDEASFAALQQRIVATLAFLDTVPRAAIDGKEEAPVTLVTPGGSIDFTGKSYVLGFVLPNFYFHITTAYALLRMRGVPIGKMHYLGR